MTDWWDEIVSSFPCIPSQGLSTHPHRPSTAWLAYVIALRRSATWAISLIAILPTSGKGMGFSEALGHATQMREWPNLQCTMLRVD